MVNQSRYSSTAEAYSSVAQDLREKRYGRDLGLMFGEETNVTISADEEGTLNSRYIGRDKNNHYFSVLNHMGNAYAIVKSKLDYTTRTKDSILCQFAHYREIDNEEQKTINTILNRQTLEELMEVLENNDI